MSSMAHTSGLLALFFVLVVGRESVLAVTNTREVRCGRRLVSGLFSRPRLPLGYSYVTTIPRGACRLNITEIIPSENYIALKITNGSYIMNGEFAVSTPGNYEAAGARFMYSRAGGLDSIFALGPVHSPIDIMVLYTQPNPSIKYEYFTESLPGEIDTDTATRPNFPEVLSTAQTKHIRRHHSFDAYPRPTVNVPRYPDFTSTSREAVSDEDVEENFIGGRKFMWKILSYTQCSRSCGGGIQVGKYRCVESNPINDKEVSPVHCSGAAPATRRRRCGNIPCPPRWRSAAWSSCPKCGPATRTRIVGCVQDHSRGITKVSDQKCPAPKPSTTDTCNIPDCIRNTPEVYLDRRLIRPRDRPITDTFRAGPVYTITVNDTESDLGPEYTFSAAAGWLYTDWSECAGWCVGGGIQTRGVRCADPSGCAPRKSPEVSKTCTPKLTCDPHDGQWFTGDWSPCSSPCGGKQVRGVLCIGGTGRHLKETACRSPKPEHERDCGGDCQATWYYSEWGQCTGNCSLGTGVQRRTVWCAKPDSASEEVECGAAKPLSQRACELHCSSIAVSTLPPDLIIESQKVSSHETTSTPKSTTIKNTQSEDCEDKLRNCALAVQARLCHYNYYMQKCCVSCNGR
ncbi:ADAM-TS spacer 1 domain-containing protein [Phthorimaea operculella]|nr:ADAM-TS spacer 1 domain-containing protein [Phthorimaea operculella]